MEVPSRIWTVQYFLKYQGVTLHFVEHCKMNENTMIPQISSQGLLRLVDYISHPGRHSRMRLSFRLSLASKWVLSCPRRRQFPTYWRTAHLWYQNLATNFPLFLKVSSQKMTAINKLNGSQPYPNIWVNSVSSKNLNIDLKVLISQFTLHTKPDRMTINSNWNIGEGAEGQKSLVHSMNEFVFETHNDLHFIIMGLTRHRHMSCWLEVFIEFTDFWQKKTLVVCRRINAFCVLLLRILYVLADDDHLCVAYIQVIDVLLSRRSWSAVGDC